MNTPTTFGRPVGLTTAEADAFDWSDFIRAAAEGDASRLGFVNEQSRAVEAQIGRSVSAPNSWFIAPELLDRLAQRDPVLPRARVNARGLDATNGAAIIGVETPSFGEVFRGSSLVDALPMQRLTGLVGDQVIPRMTSVTVGWFTDSTGAAADAAPALGQLSLTPKTCAAYVLLSQQMRRQQSPAASAFVRSELARAAGAEVGRVLFAGTHLDGEPLTPFEAPGVTEQDGSSMTWAKAVALLNPCESVGDPGAVRWVVGANAAGVLRQKVRESGQASYILDGGQIAGYPAIISSNAPTGALHCANWGAVVYAQWAGIEVAVSPFGATTAGTDFRTGKIAVRVMTMVDFGTVAPAALARTTGTLS